MELLFSKLFGYLTVNAQTISRVYIIFDRTVEDRAAIRMRAFRFSQFTKIQIIIIICCYLL